MPALDSGTGELADFEARIALGSDGRIGYGPVAAGCNTAMCGNAPNLRASSARRKPSEKD